MIDEAITSTRPVEQRDTIEGKRRRELPKWVYPFAGIFSGTLLIGLHATRFGNWIVDDAAITFAYARNVADGHGPVLQSWVEPTEGFSNPSWLALLSVGRFLGLFDRGTIFGVPDYVLFPKALALICCAGILTAFYVAAKRVAEHPGLVVFVAGVVLAANPSFVIWCFSGMENALFGLAVTWLAVVMFGAATDGRLLTTRVALIAGGLAALAALTRPDGLLYGMAYPLVAATQLARSTLRASMRSAGLAVGAFLLPIGAYFLWRYLEFGKLLSLPALAKGQSTPSIENLTRTSELVEYGGTLAGVAFAVLVGMVLVRPSKLRSGMVPLLVTLTLAVVAYVVLVPDWMTQLRFATPVWTLSALAGTLAAGAAVRDTGIRGRVLLVVGLVAVLIPSGTLFASASEKFRDAPTVPMCLVAERLGRAFNAYADILEIKDGSVLMPDVGATAMTSRLRVVDLAGLTEPRMAEFWANKQWVELGNYIYDEVKPTFIHSHAPWSDMTGVIGDSRLSRDYVAIRFRPDNPESGDWVRKDAVTSQTKFDAAVEYATRQVTDSTNKIGGAPRGHCGATLSPGQTPLGAK
jgi:hypothetical protein